MIVLTRNPRTRTQRAIDSCNDALFAQYNAAEPDERLIQALEACIDRLMAEATAAQAVR